MSVRHIVASFPRFAEAPVDPPPVDPPPTTPGESVTASSFTVDGFAVTLAADAQIGSFVGPDISTRWVRPISPATTVTVNAYTPAFRTSPAIINGAMVNIVVGRSNTASDRQGFRVLDTSQGTPEGSIYSENSRAALPITLSPGDCLILAEGTEDLTIYSGANIKNRQFRKFAFIHCVDFLPDADEFAPPIVWDDALGAKPRYRYSDIDESNIPSLSTAGYSSTRPTPNDLFDRTPEPGNTRRRLLDHHNSAGSGSSSQPSNGRKIFQAGDGARTYGRDILSDIDWMFAYICSDAPIEEKREIIQFICQRGIDTYGFMQASMEQHGQWLAADGGHQQGRALTMTIAGALLGDNAMRDAMKTRFAPMGAVAPADYAQYVYVTPESITASQQLAWNGAGGGRNWPYETAMGETPAVPEWTGRTAVGGGFDFGQVNNLWESSNYYRRLSIENQSGALAALHLLGLEDAFGHPAMVNYQARHHAIRFYGDDPWRYIGGSSIPRYDIVSGAPAVASLTTFNDWFYDTHVFSDYPFPTEVTTPFVPRPSVRSFAISSNGTSVTVRTTIPLDSGTTQASEWSLTRDGVNIPISVASRSVSNVVLTLSSPIPAGGDCRFGYTGTSLSGGGQALTPTTAGFVSNNSTQ